MSLLVAQSCDSPCEITDVELIMRWRKGFQHMLNLDSIVQRNREVMAAEAGQDLVMVSIENGLYYGVSDIAREVWVAIEHPKRISDLITDLLATYNVDRARCEAETLSFLKDLLSEHLLQVKNESAL